MPNWGRCRCRRRPGLPPDFGDRLAEWAAAAGVALGLVAARRGERATGPVAVTTGVLGVGPVAALAVRWPTVLPALTAGSIHDRWWLLAALGVTVAAHAGRDPGVDEILVPPLTGPDYWDNAVGVAAQRPSILVSPMWQMAQ